MRGNFADLFLDAISGQIPEIASAEHLDPVFHAALSFDRRRPVEEAGLAHF